MTNISERSWIESIAGFVLAAFVITGVISIALVMYFNNSIPNSYINLGPLLLVLVTLINIGLSGLGYLESRKERRLNRETLSEYRKDGIIELLARSTKRYMEGFYSDRRKINVETYEFPLYGELEGVPISQFLSEDIINDIEKHYPDIRDDFSEYIDVRRRYVKQRRTAKEKIKSSITDKLPNHISEELHNEGASERSIIHNSEDLAEIVLTGTPPESSTGWVESSLDQTQEPLLEWRKSEELVDCFRSLDCVAKELLTISDKIEEEIEDVEEEVMSTYNITHAEIKSREEELGLDQTEVDVITL
ncbi:hypothetical protein G9464_02065 [Halostella sp. JP-L12]|uniref:hypothetical protein n=1 Tax=Halostella TaxID=1843185 RepID=UPI0013CEBA2C|nr:MULTISPECIES: hypothetical protein [Halostella]NHN46387.1 hypothetical protein [Halostella sp. JP-L12]